MPSDSPSASICQLLRNRLRSAAAAAPVYHEAGGVEAWHHTLACCLCWQPGQVGKRRRQSLQTGGPLLVADAQARAPGLPGRSTLQASLHRVAKMCVV